MSGEPGCKVHLSSLKEEFPDGIEEPCVELECDVDISDELVEQGSGLLYILDKFYADQKIELDPNLSKQSSVSTKAKRNQRAKVKSALKIILPHLRSQLRKRGLKYSRQQLLESLVPVAGKKGVAKGLIAESKLISETKAAKLYKSVKKNKLNHILNKLCSRGTKSFFVKFRARLLSSAPKPLVAFLEDGAALDAKASLPPVEPQSTAAVGVEPQNTAAVGVEPQSTAAVGVEPQSTAAVGIEPQSTAAVGVEPISTDRFPAGSDVSVVVEDCNFQRFLGCTGKVERSEGDHVHVVFDVDHSLGIAAHELPFQLLERVTLPLKPAPKLKTMVRQSRSLKQALLAAGEVLDPEQDVLTLLKIGDQSSDDQIDVFCATVCWSFDLSESTKLKVVPARFVGRIVCDLNGEAFSYNELCSPPELVKKRMRILQRWLASFEVLIVPIWGRGPPQHWTLLKIEKTAVTYRDSLRPLHKGCMSNANKLLSALGLEGVETVANGAVQKSDDCGWFVCHWIEEELRVLSGQPKQSQGWPNKGRLSNLQQWLKRIIESLENEREKFAEERKAMAIKEAELELQLAKKAKAFIEQKGLLEKLVEFHNCLAKYILEDGKGKSPPPLDAAFLKKLQEHREKLEQRRLEKRAIEPAPVEIEPLPMAIDPVPVPIELAPVEIEPAPAAIDPVPVPIEPAPVEIEPAPAAIDPVPVPTGAAPSEIEPASVATVLDPAEPKPSAIEKLRQQLSEKGVDVFNVLLETATVADLRPSLQDHMHKVEKEGAGVCSKCRWLSGCLNCDVKKAWIYCVKVELGISSGNAVGQRAVSKKL